MHTEIGNDELQRLEDALGELGAAEVIRISKYLPPQEGAELRELELKAALKERLAPTSTDESTTKRALHQDSFSYFFNMACCCKSPLCRRGIVGSEQLRSLKMSVFGDNPHEYQRRERYYDLLHTAWRRQPGSGIFIFYIGPHRVCERASRLPYECMVSPVTCGGHANVP